MQKNSLEIVLCNEIVKVGAFNPNIIIVDHLLIAEWHTSQKSYTRKSIRTTHREYIPVAPTISFSHSLQVPVHDGACVNPVQCEQCLYW